MTTIQSLVKPELLKLSAEEWAALGPQLWLFGAALVATVFSAFRWLKPKWPVILITWLGALGGIVLACQQMAQPPLTLFNGMMVIDGFTGFFTILFLASLAFSVAASIRYLDDEGLQYPEYYLLMLLSALGMVVMTAALDLIVLFIGLELMSLAVYVLVGFRRADRRSNEGAMKYFILGSAASAVLLYGSALLYGATGSLTLTGILAFVQGHPQALSPMFAVGAWLVVIGFLFKVAAVPFHMWMPDVYEGAPTPVTGFMTTGLKAAAFATFTRVLVSLGYGRGLSTAIQAHFHDLLWVVAVATLVVGNFVALRQINLKRMLAYSSIAHSGYLLMGLLSAPSSQQGYAPVVFYLVTYAAMNLGAFAVLTLVAGKSDRGLNRHDLAGLGRRHPLIAAALAVFIFSMAGIPPTAGFASKYWIFYSAVQAKEIPLVVIGVLSSAVSAYYYLRVLVALYMEEPTAGTHSEPVSVWGGLTVAAMLLLTLGLGLAPEGSLNAAKKAVSVWNPPAVASLPGEVR
jgi:NADH-quinone oxidoreductase subunit N